MGGSIVGFGEGVGREREELGTWMKVTHRGAGPRVRAVKPFGPVMFTVYSV